MTSLNGIDSIKNIRSAEGDKSSTQLFDILNFVKQIADERTNVGFDEKLWRVKDVADFLQMSEGHIYNLSARGQIPKLKKGRTLFFRPKEIMDWLQNGEQ